MKLPIKILIAGFLCAGLVHQSYGDFHFWSINEVFSSADGTVQFIELATSVPGQGVLTGHSLVSSDGGVNQNVINFTHDLDGNTQNTTLLIATEKFASITGLTPDFTIPEKFIFTGGGQLNFGEGADIFNFTREQFPLNGVQAINGNGSPQTATPTNFAGLSATISTDTYATLNFDTLVMNVPVLDISGSGILNISLGLDLDTLLFTVLDNAYLYENGITSGDRPAEFQSNGVLYIPGLLLGSDLYELSLTILGDGTLVFGNLTILSVTNLVPDPDPDPAPDPNSLWFINEAFSSADETVQFIELATSEPGQQVLTNLSLVSSDGGVNQNAINFTGDLVGDTQNKTVLIATEKFASITGLIPDFIIPEKFIFAGGGQLNFGEDTDILSFTREQFPLNGVQSIGADSLPQTATPTNFAGLSAAISTDTYASLNFDTFVMNVPVVLNASGNDIGNWSFSLDINTLQFTLMDGFYVYGNGITAGDNPAEFQNNSMLYIPGLNLGSQLWELNLTVVGEDPLIFGNLTVLSIIDLEPESEPTDPYEEPTEL